VQQERSGRYYLTIERVEGDKVFGKGRVEGRRASDLNFTGTLSGNRLTYGQVNVADFMISEGRGRAKYRVG
jgi:hypothetical protein